MSSVEPTQGESVRSPSRGKSRFAREITSIIALPVLIWIIGWTPGLVVAFLAALAALGGLWEFLAMGEKKGLPVQKGLSCFLLLFLLAAFLLPGLPVEAGVFAVILLIPAAYVFSRTDLTAALPASAVCVFAILYVGFLTGAVIRLRLDFGNRGSDLLFFLLIVVWVGDTMAYYTGKNFGRTKLLARVSPKKTVEGLLGGIAGSIIGAAIVHFTFFPEFPLGHAMICALILSLAGVTGDLAESVWKRSASVKDSGSLIPGHGGILDRLDSILFSAPFLYAYWYLLNEGVVLLST